jgi:uncharacterized membrane protein
MPKKKKPAAITPYRLIISLALLCGVSAILLISRMLDTSSFRYTFLFWNLFLAFVPVLLGWWLNLRIRQFGWLKWEQILLSILWLVFLPNSFYLITDLIHLRPNYEADLLFDITVLMSFIIAGLAFGFLSVYFVHTEIIKRFREKYAYLIIAGLFLLVSFAICLGRYTRWNTWDIILRPAGLLFDVSDRLINPGFHAQTYLTTVTLFLLLFSSYLVVWESARFLRGR